MKRSLRSAGIPCYDAFRNSFAFLSRTIDGSKGRSATNSRTLRPTHMAKKLKKAHKKIAKKKAVKKVAKKKGGKKKR